MAIRRAWDIQVSDNWWLSLGFHVDHTDPSLTLHIPGAIVSIGRVKQPGFKYSLRFGLRSKRHEPDYIAWWKENWPGGGKPYIRAADNELYQGRNKQ